jgi:acyl carrier protein
MTSRLQDPVPRLSPPEIALLLREQLQQLKFMPANSALGDQQSLFDAGVLDSLRLMELVARLESRLGINVAPDDLAPENFESIDSMTGYLRGQLDRKIV